MPNVWKTLIACLLCITFVDGQNPERCFYHKRHLELTSLPEAPSRILVEDLLIPSPEQCFDTCCKMNSGTDSKCNGATFEWINEAASSVNSRPNGGKCMLLSCVPHFRNCPWTWSSKQGLVYAAEMIRFKRYAPQNSSTNSTTTPTIVDDVTITSPVSVWQTSNTSTVGYYSNMPKVVIPTEPATATTKIPYNWSTIFLSAISTSTMTPVMEFTKTSVENGVDNFKPFKNVGEVLPMPIHQRSSTPTATKMFVERPDSFANGVDFDFKESGNQLARASSETLTTEIKTAFDKLKENRKSKHSHSHVEPFEMLMESPIDGSSRVTMSMALLASLFLICVGFFVFLMIACRRTSLVRRRYMPLKNDYRSSGTDYPTNYLVTQPIVSSGYKPH